MMHRVALLGGSLRNYGAGGHCLQTRVAKKMYEWLLPFVITSPVAATHASTIPSHKACPTRMAFVLGAREGEPHPCFPGLPAAMCPQPRKAAHGLYVVV